MCPRPLYYVQIYADDECSQLQLRVSQKFGIAQDKTTKQRNVQARFHSIIHLCNVCLREDRVECVVPPCLHLMCIDCAARIMETFEHKCPTCRQILEQSTLRAVIPKSNDFVFADCGLSGSCYVLFVL
jgi:hypothetical protein